MNLEQFINRAKETDDKIRRLETKLRSIVQDKCKQYKYEILYYNFLKNRGNFVRLLFIEAGIPFKEIGDRSECLKYFKCANKFSQENAKRMGFTEIMAPPAIIRTPIGKNKNNEPALASSQSLVLSQTAALYQFLSGEFNLRPATLENYYLSEMLVSDCNDILSDIYNHRLDKYDELNKFYTNRMQIWLDILQKPLTKSATQEYYFDDKCLAVDVCVYNMCEGILEIMGERQKELFIDTHKILYQHYKRIKNRPNIKEFVDNQDNTWWPDFIGFPECKKLLNSPQTNIQQTGGWKQADKEEINATANAVRSQVEQQASKQNLPKFTCFEAISGKKQVVAGMNFKIKIKIGDNRFCEIFVYRSLPPIKYELKSATFPEKKAKKKKSGGWNNAEKEEMIAAANAVRSDVEQQAAKNNDDEKLECYEVLGGKKQVVAGLNFKIKLKIGEKKFCEILVYRSLPPIKYELKSAKFFGQKAKKPKTAAGGWKEAEKEEINAAANAVKEEVEKQAVIKGKPIKIYDVEEGTKQVVAGLNLKIKIKVDTQRWCEIIVYRSLPPIKYELKNVTWIETKQKPSKQVLGGWKIADHQEITAAANSVKDDVEKQRVQDKQGKFDTYLAVSGTKQVVAGVNYKIKIKIGKQRFCEIEVFRSLPPISCELKSVKW